MIKAHFPSHVALGKSINMTCDYDTEGERVYQVKWYKDDNEFYTYVPGRLAKTFDTSGVNIDNIDVSNMAREAILKNIALLSKITNDHYQSVLIPGINPRPAGAPGFPRPAAGGV